MIQNVSVTVKNINTICKSPSLKHVQWTFSYTRASNNPSI